MTRALSLSELSKLIEPLLTPAELEKLLKEAHDQVAREDAHQQQVKLLPEDWETRIPALFAPYMWHGFSQPHQQLWGWENAIDATNTPRPFTAFWPRNRGKSTSAEGVAVDIGVRGVRRYCMYVSGTQEQADKHVQTVARMLESERVFAYAPSMGAPRIGQNGNRLWNRQILTTGTGYTVEAIGLDRAVRGQKIDWARPDLIILDDIDDRHDSKARSDKKEASLVESILPAGASHCAVLFVQNLIHADSVASRLAKKPDEDGAAQYLLDRIISGPFKAVDGLKTERVQEQDADGTTRFRWKITEGKSIWNGYTLAMCEVEINRVGPSAFGRESQHDVEADNPNALMTAADFETSRVQMHPPLARIGIGVDPPGGATECGIVCVGTAKVGKDMHGYTLEDASQPAGVKSEVWALAVLKCYVRNQADVVFVETNYGGDMAMSVIRQAKWLDGEGNVLCDGSQINIQKVVATRGKLVRAEPLATVFQQGRAHHVGEYPEMEKEWRRYVPGVSASPNRLDAEVWAYTGLQLANTGWARA